jgi:signal transduction histidine kinase
MIMRAERSVAEKRRLFIELQDAYQCLKNNTLHAEALAEAHECQRMVRELHDSLTQTLFCMNLAVQAAQLAARQDTKEVISHLQRLRLLSRDAAGEVQMLTGQAQAPVFPEEKLSVSLEKLAADRQIQGSLIISLDVTGEIELSRSVKSNLYHIVQEALNNAAKHAGVCEVFIRVDLAGHPAIVEIADNGCGFDLNDLGSHAGIGLNSMAERAEEIGWEFRVATSPGMGTLIRIEEKIT